MNLGIRALAIACAVLHLGGCAAPSSVTPTTAVKSSKASEPEQEAEPQVPPGHMLREYVTCHEVRVNGKVVSKRNPIRFINGGVKPMDGSCVKLDADGWLRPVPGQCFRVRSIDGPCEEAK